MARHCLERREWMAGVTAGFCSALTGTAWGQDRNSRKSSRNLMKPETREAIRKGLAYLKSQQNEDGSFGSRGYSRNVAVCALSGMAFMASGSTPGRGRFGQQVQRSLNYILNNVQPSGFITAAASAGRGRMYGHGFATLFLAEAHGMSRNPALREKLEKAIKLIVETQNDEGGWRYEPKKLDADISVTICQVMALRAARNAGIYVPNETIEKCIEYVKQSQNADGGFMYMLSQPGESLFPRSAAGVVALYSAGIYEGEELERGLDYLMQHVPHADAPVRGGHFFYGHYYGVQAMWHAGGERWKKWYPAIHDVLLNKQRDEGAWFSQICPEYGTAMACIVLQMPNNYLPIFQN